jgi:hypothetical protein
MGLTLSPPVFCSLHLSFFTIIIASIAGDAVEIGVFSSSYSLDEQINNGTIDSSKTRLLIIKKPAKFSLL